MDDVLQVVLSQLAAIQARVDAGFTVLESRLDERYLELHRRVHLLESERQRAYGILAGLTLAGSTLGGTVAYLISRVLGG